MPDRGDVPAARGDEAELFRAFNDELVRSVRHAVRASTAEVIEDACAYAWAAFMEHQPDRDGDWRGWLFRSAQHHAWKLERAVRETRALDSQTLDARRSALESIDVIEVRHDVDDAMSILAPLPARLRRIAVLRALGFHHGEMGALTGLSRARVHQLVERASRQVAESLAERHRSGTGQPARAQRLRQLEVDPPDWLVAKIGRSDAQGRESRPPQFARRHRGCVCLRMGAVLGVPAGSGQELEGWLVRTAQRQAWLLEAQISDLVSRWNADDALSGLAEPISLDERFDVGEGVQDALSIVSQLSPRLQRIAMLRALGFGYDDIGEITGDSPSRVNRLVSSANSQIREILDERAHATQRSSPRAKRLWELEHDPPKWLVAQIGRPVRPSRKIPGRALRQRAWRRAALALDDYRAAAGEAAFDERGLDEPTEARLRPLHINAAKAVREFAAQRDRERCGHER